MINIKSKFMQINKITIGVRDPINSRVRFRNRTQHTRSLVLGVRGVVWEDLRRAVFLYTILVLTSSFTVFNRIETEYNNKLSDYRIRMLSDTCKAILLYSVNNITDEIIAKIEVKIIVKNGKITNGSAKVLENNMDGINSVKKIVLSIENDFVILQVKLNDDLEFSNKNERKWVGDVSASIFLGLNKEGNIKSFTSNSGIEDSNLRFGGVFLDQSKGVFRTTADRQGS